METDSRFTDRNKWLSSDYMFKALRSDPQNLLKRLGDGFYEQRLVNEQINQITGRRFLENYDSDYEQYKALMDNGAYYAKKWNLVPGVALTAAQMKELTTDMVWMVKKEVTLKDGTKTTVLAPQVYVVARNSDIDSRGAVISANDVIVNIKGDVQNSGVIAGRNLTGLAANNIENLGGRLQGRELYLAAKNTLDNLGGELNAAQKLVAQGKNINLESTTSETANTPDFYRKSLSQQASVNVGTEGEKGAATFIASENITVKGAKVNVQGDATFSAGNKLSLGTIETENKEHYVPNADNYYKLDQKQEVGSQLNVTGNVDLVGKSAVEMRGVSVSSNGTVNALSEGNIAIQEARKQESLSSASKSKSRGLVSSTTEIYRHNHHYDLAEGSSLDADKINLYSSNGNVTVQGSNVVAENGLTVQAKNIDIKEAENRVYSDDFYSKKKSGLLSGGIGITFGSQKQTTEADQTKYYASGSQVGSLNGNTTMIAENNYTQTASAVSAVKGDVNILAKQATIQAADDKYETNTKQTFEQKGLTIAITSPILSALQAVQGAVQSAEKVGKSKNDRVNAMSAANAGMDAYRAGQAVGQAHKAVSDFMNGTENIDSVVGVQITYGQQKSVSKTHTEGSTASTSQVNAGGKVNIVATGAGKDSNINIKGADVSGKQGTTLIADNNVNITAAEQHHKERSTNKSSGFNAGVAIKVSNGVAAGVTVGGNYGKGYGNGDETTYVASHVGDANSQTTVMAGGDANLIGSQLKGKRVELDAQNLNIESLQDKSTYKGKQMNVAGSVTVGYGFAASGSYSQSKINADHASVNEQAGIYAGDEGYNINVNKHTDLKGAIITSTQQEEDNGKNQFTTGSLTHSDIENHSNYSGSSFGVSGSVAANFDTPFGKDGEVQSKKQAKNEHGQLLYQDKDGNVTTTKTNKPLPAHGMDSLDVGHSIGYGSDKDSQSSTTKSGINTQNITIKDETEQLKRTGKTAQETIAAIKTGITTDNAETQSGKLDNRFDKDKVQKELDYQREVTQDFYKNRQKLKTELLAKADSLFVEARLERYKNGGEDNDKSRDLEAKAHNLSQFTSYIDTALGVAWGLTHNVDTAIGMVVAEHADYAKNAGTHQTAGSVYKLDCSGAAAQRYCRDMDDKTRKVEWEGGAKEIYDIKQIQNYNDKNAVISNPGIYNTKYEAFRNAVKQNPEAAANGNLYVVINNPSYEAIPFLSEVGFYALYDKVNEIIGAKLPLTNAERTNVDINKHAALNSVKLEKSNHSRGSMTESVSLQYTNNHPVKDKNGNKLAVPLEKVRFVGAAADGKRYYNALEKNGYVTKDGVSSTFGQATHKLDFVGVPLGWNTPTGGACDGLCYSHSGYHGKVPEPFIMLDNKPLLDKDGKKIENSEYGEYVRLWGKSEINENSNKVNKSAPKILLKDYDGKFHLKETSDGNGTFEFGGRKYYENIY